MGLQDAWRKAAGLLIEVPDAPPPSSDDLEEADALIEGRPDSGLGSNVARDAAMDDVDRLLARTAPATPGAVPAPASANTKGAAKTVEQIVRDAEGPNLDEIARRVPDATADAAPGKKVTPADIYAAAKLPAVPFSAEQMLDMLHSLPAELPLETKRATVKVTLGALGKTMGATPETIAADASRKMASLAAYADHLSKRTEEFAAREEAAVAEMQKQIEVKRQSIVAARQNSQRSMELCKVESERLDDVLEFFSLDVPPSKYAAGAALPTSNAASTDAGSAKPKAS